MELPSGFKKVKNIDFEMIFEVPESLEISESLRYSIEILDEVMFEAIGKHFLDPLLNYTVSYQAVQLHDKREKSAPKFRLNNLYKSPEMPSKVLT